MACNCQAVESEFPEQEYPLSEEEEMDLALELLTVSDEQELDQFLGKLLKKAWKGVRRFASKVARPVGRILKSVAKKALPWVAGAAGGLLGPAGAAAGTALGSALSKALEAEMESIDPADRELELSKRFVRMAVMGARRAALAPQSNDPATTALSALQRSAQQLVRANGSGSAHSGEWVRRGRIIVVSEV